VTLACWACDSVISVFCNYAKHSLYCKMHADVILYDPTIPPE
jgi:hypothetical protein